MVKIPAEMDKLTANEWREIGFSRAEFEGRWKARLERDKGSPAIGSDAPDFELEVLSKAGKQTGTFLKLSSFYGRPIGLVFGSYT